MGMRSALTTAALAALLCAAGCGGSGRRTVGLLTVVEGDVQARSATGEDWHAAAAGDAVREGDSLKLGEAASVQLDVIRAAAAIRIEAGSEITIEKQIRAGGASGMEIHLHRGTLRTWNAQESRQPVYRVLTPVALVEAAAADFLVAHAPDDSEPADAAEPAVAEEAEAETETETAREPSQGAPEASGTTTVTAFAGDILVWPAGEGHEDQPRIGPASGSSVVLTRAGLSDAGVQVLGPAALRELFYRTKIGAIPPSLLPRLRMALAGKRSLDEPEAPPPAQAAPEGEPASDEKSPDGGAEPEPGEVSVPDVQPGPEATEEPTAPDDEPVPVEEPGSTD